MSAEGPYSKGSDGVVQFVAGPGLLGGKYIAGVCTDTAVSIANLAHAAGVKAERERIIGLLNTKTYADPEDLIAELRGEKP